jgi:hypothetical protein
MNFDWHTLLGTAASVLLLLLLVPYIKSITGSTTRPSAVSWFGWMLLFIIETAAQASKGIDWSLAVPAISLLSTAIITFTALRMGRAVWTSADRYCIALAAAAIILWAITKEPLVALVLSVVADIAVSLPTIIKTYQEPESEPRTLWSLYALGCFMAVIATTDLTIYNLLVPVYSVVVAGVIAFFARGRLAA